MMKTEGYLDLIVAVTGADRNDILPLRESDIKMIDEIISSLGSQSGRSYADVLNLRFGLKGEKHTLKRAGEKFSVSGPAVRVQEFKALRLLKHPSRIRMFNQFLHSYLEETIQNLEKVVQEKDTRIEELELIIKQARKILAKKTIVRQTLQLLIKRAIEVLTKADLSCISFPEKETLANSVLRMPIDNFELSVRAYNCLRNNNIKTIGDLVQKAEWELLRTKNFGRKSLNELRVILEKYNLKFGMKNIP